MTKQNRIFRKFQFSRTLIYSFLLLGVVLLLTNYCKKDASPASITCNGSGYFYSDSSTRVIFPNAFSPNGTGPVLNETFGGFGKDFSNFSLTIKDISGTTLFFDTVIANHWDGKDLNGKIKEGYYTAYISFRNIVGTTISKTMDITLYVNAVNINNGRQCIWGDMINPLLGFIYQTKEPIN